MNQDQRLTLAARLIESQRARTDMNHVLGYSGAMHPRAAIPFPKVPLAFALLYHLRLRRRRIA